MFHWIKKEHAEAIVRKYCRKEGSYLLRPSTDIDEKHFAITLSVPSEANVRHLRVNIEKKQSRNGTKFCYYITSTRPFSTFLDFLKYYYVHPICCDHDIKVKLLRGLGYSNRNSTLPGRRFSEPDFIFSVDAVGDRQAELGSTVQRASSPNLHNSAQSDLHPSVANFTSSSNSLEKDTLYHNQMVIRQRTLTDPKYRPPPSIPKTNDSNYEFSYSVVPEKKNYFEETYNHLKETELCECGLRVIDTSLPGGWTIHKFCDTGVFFQYGETHTSWDIPADIAQQLTNDQINFINFLCNKIGCTVPGSLKSVNELDQASLKGNTESTPPVSEGESSETDAGEKHQTDHPYETPAPLVVLSSPFSSSSAVTRSASHLSQSSPFPDLSQEPGSSKSDNAATGQSCSSSQYPPDVISSEEGSFSNSPVRQRSFKSIPAVTIQAMTGPPSVTPRTKSLTQS